MAAGTEAGTEVPFPLLEVQNASLAALDAAAAEVFAVANDVIVLPPVESGGSLLPASPAIEIALPVQGGVDRRPGMKERCTT